MTDTMLYLSKQDVRTVGLSPREVREAVLDAFRDHAHGLNSSLPKSSLMLGAGHGFQSMLAASQPAGLVGLKFVAMAPVPAGSDRQGINGLICLSDYETGAPAAVLDGDEITLARTAAMSAAAATRLAPAAPRTIGFVGCGLQAHAHLDAFLDLFPGLTTALALSRSVASAEALVEEARRRGLAGEVVSEPDRLLSRCDIVISMVPGAPGLVPFLDAAQLPAQAFASAVDIGRSWRPETLPAFDVLATDSLAQSKAPYDVNGEPVGTARFGTDLAALAASDDPPAAAGRSLFCFRGFALADLAIAGLVLRRAQERGIGLRLPR